MSSNSNDDLSAVYDNVPDALLIGMARRCFNQLQRRRLISFDDTIEVLAILHNAIDNAIDLLHGADLAQLLGKPVGPQARA